MTIQILQGFAIISDPSQTNAATTEVLPIELRIVVPDVVTSFSYTLTGATPPANEFPEVDIDVNDLLAAVNSIELGTMEALSTSLQTYIGQITHSGGQVTQILNFEVESPGTDIQFLFVLGGAALSMPTSLADLTALENSITAVGAIPAGTALSAGASIPFSSIPNRTTVEDNFVNGTPGDDTLSGTSGNDVYFPGINDSYDRIDGSVGDDLYDFSNSQTGDFYEVRYNGLNGPITVNIDEDSGLATVDKGAGGTDHWIDAFRAANWNTGDGMGVFGTGSNDVFHINLSDEDTWFGINGGAGNDTYHLHGVDIARIDFSYDGNTNATAGVVVNLNTGVVANDGFGGSDQINVLNSDIRVEIRGTDHNDAITGSARDERFILEQGMDTLNAGGGVDLLRYDRSGVDAITVNLASATATGTWDDIAFSHEIHDIEEVYGSREASDSITGDSSDNRFRGRGGDDTLIGGGGSDTLIGEEGDDSLDGGDGDDYADFWINRADATITQGSLAGQATVVSALGTDVISNVEYLRFNDETVDLRDPGGFGATSGDDQLNGTAAADLIDGLEGNDDISGGDGDDTLIGNDGGDTLRGGEGNDSLDGGNGVDWFFGGTGNDTMVAGTDGSRDRLSYQDSTGAVTVDLAAGTASDGEGGSDTLIGDFRVIGSGFNDTLRGDAGNNSFSGEMGDDLIEGGDGFDFVWYGRADAAVTVNLATGVVTGGEDTDTLSSIEGIGGTNFADNITGSDADNWFNLDQDGDIYTPNYLVGGADTLDGGGGRDTVSYWNASNGVTVNLSSGSATDGLGNTDSLSNIEDVEGSAHNDRLTGDDQANTLSGLDGTDTLIGGAGNDSLVGGTSENDLRDVIYGGDGDDTIDGGYGNDELRGDAGNDNIAGSYGADTVIGGAGDDVLTGSAYGDVIFGGDGMDFINGGFGHDRVNGGADADRFFHIGVEGHGSDWIQDYVAADGDVLQYGGTATRDQFQVNFNETAEAGTAGVEEAFVIYRPTGQILWALVDGAGQAEINLLLAGVTYDLMA